MSGRSLNFLAKDLSKYVDRKDLVRFDGHATAIMRLKVHGLLTEGEARKCNARLLKNIREAIRRVSRQSSQRKWAVGK